MVAISIDYFGREVFMKYILNMYGFFDIQF